MQGSPEMPWAPRPGDICLTWITGRTGVWVSVMQWISGDGGLWPWRRVGKGVPKGYPTHAAVVLHNSQVLEAQPGGAVISKITRYRRRPVLYAELPLTDEQRAQVQGIAEEYVGTPYGWLDYLYLGLWRLHVRPGWLRESVRTSDRMTCSQLCDRLAERLGLHLFADGRLNQDVTPGDLFNLFEANEWWRTPS